MNFVLMLDQIRILFVFSVSLISFSVLNFSKSYIIRDKNFTRFHFLLITFILRIYFLILSPNIVRLLLGWDGLGLRSYLLVIYYGRSKAYNSGIITALTNRFGDSLILLRIGYLIIMGNWNIYYYSLKFFDQAIIILIILAASTKRAQIPFSAWLPAAIAAPTPVSSLVHSSTLVTAGVYLLIRHETFFSQNNMTSYIIIIGIFTMFMASVRALFETDLKKMVALSTLRQLGIMFLSLGLGRFLLRYFHLLTHAFFKALLFLATGAIIHRRKDYQDLRLTGARSQALPTINRFILIARFSLIGLPFISAFFSKEIILEIILLKNFNFVVYLIIILGIGLTAIYRSRFIFLVFSGWNLNDIVTLKLEEDYNILKSMSILVIPASLGGVWIYLYLLNGLKLSASFYVLKLITLAIIARFIIISINSSFSKSNWRFYLWRSRNIWFLPHIRAQIFNLFIFNGGPAIFKIMDRGVFRFKFVYVYLYLQRALRTVTLKLINKMLLLFVVWIIILFVFYLCNTYYIKAIIKTVKIRPCSKILNILTLFILVNFEEVSLALRKVNKENLIIR